MGAAVVGVGGVVAVVGIDLEFVTAVVVVVLGTGNLCRLETEAGF